MYQVPVLWYIVYQTRLWECMLNPSTAPWYQQAFSKPCLVNLISSYFKHLDSCCWCLLYFCYFPMWYPWSGVVLDCIVSWSLPPFCFTAKDTHLVFSIAYMLVVCIAFMATYINMSQNIDWEGVWSHSQHPLLVINRIRHVWISFLLS